jgi:hypothetical protein
MGSFLDALTARDPETIRLQMMADAGAMNVDTKAAEVVALMVALFSLDARAQAKAEALRVQIVNAGFPHLAPLAGDDWVDACLFGFFAEKRIGATTTVWSWPVSCAANAGPYTIGAGTRELVAVADDGTLFESTNPTAVTIPSGGSAFVQFTCRTGGLAGNQISGAVTRFISTKPGLSVTNVGGVAVAAGRDAELNTEYLARCLGKWAALGAGYTKQAFDYLIPLYAPTVTRWFVNDANPFGPGTIGLWLANAAGPATVDEVAAVFNGLNGPARKPLGTGLLQAFPAVARVVHVAGTLFPDGTNSALLASVTSALNVLQARWKIGALLPVELLDGVIMGGGYPQFAVPGFSGISDYAPISPLTDTVLLPYEVLSLTISLVVGTL